MQKFSYIAAHRKGSRLVLELARNWGLNARIDAGKYRIAKADMVLGDGLSCEQALALVFAAGE